MSVSKRNADTLSSRALARQPSERWFVYVARCADGSLYTGIAIDVAARILAHDSGKGARYTRGRGPLVVCAKRRCASKGEALRLEAAMKKLSRAGKEHVVSRARGLASLARTLSTKRKQ